MPADSAQKIVLITGCSEGGIGHHLALEFATTHGCRVYATARNTSKIPAGLQRKEADGRLAVTALELDVTSQESIDAAMAFISEDTGGRSIDILVNNAGQICVSPAVEVDVAQAMRVFDTNVLGVTRMCKAVAPQMMDARRGTIVNVGSVSGYATTPWVGYYAASKAALHMLTDSLRMELSMFDVSVVLLAPGGVRSNLHANGAAVLGDGTRYALARDQVDKRAEFSQIGNATPAPLFARVVVPQILRQRPPAYITYGNHSTAMWVLYYLPWWMRDYIVGTKFGTRRMRQQMQTSATAKPAASAVSMLAVAASVGAVALAYAMYSSYSS
ncbi:hypothetical protein H4S06_001570 [Coemansia sp. BCRC 34490]|nr:hypothetical protein H4S06_001570 [Coemansia sp. BCRC 34490]